jgi:lysozyme family protein
MLQRSLNALNGQGKYYADIAVDADVGPASIAALKAYLTKRGPEGEAVMLKALNCLQGDRYIELSEKRPANEDFLFGWLRTRVA